MTENDQRREDKGQSFKAEWVLDKAEFGRELKARRVRAGMDSAEDLSDALKLLKVSISADTIWAIERGKQYPSLEQFVVLCIALGLSDQLLSFESAMRGSLAGRLRQIVK